MMCCSLIHKRRDGGNRRSSDVSLNNLAGKRPAPLIQMLIYLNVYVWPQLSHTELQQNTLESSCSPRTSHRQHIHK